MAGHGFCLLRVLLQEEICIAAEEEIQALLFAEAGGTVVVIVGSGLQGPEAIVEVGPRGLSETVRVERSCFPLVGAVLHQANRPFLKHCSSKS